MLTTALLAASLALRAEPAKPPEGPTVVRLELTPAAPPAPVSSLYLLPDYRERQPGDQLSGFMKCFMEQDNFFNLENSQKREKWRVMPLAELPADVREQAHIKNGVAYDPPFASLMVMIDQAARFNRVEWNEYFNLRRDGVYWLLPEIQKLRALMHVVHLRMRGEVKNGEFARAAASARTLLGMAKMLETHPTLIGNLVGMAAAAMALEGVEEAVQQPGCPSLFWSLVDLPAPLVSVRHGLAGERTFLVAQFTELRDPKRTLTDAEVEAELAKLADIMKYETDPKTGPTAQVARYRAFADDPTHVAASRTVLTTAGGIAADAAASFSPLRAVLAADLVQLEIYRDELLKWANLPATQAAGMTGAEASLRAASAKLVLAPLMLPSLTKVKASEARTDQRVALLRVIEALRLHAHSNGAFPASLDAVKLPLPPDPVSGKPFDYAVKDGVATLTGANPTPDKPSGKRIYELRLRK